jgi:hypothetical protein
MLDFAALKQIPLTSVCATYGIALTFGGKYAKAKCPLPTHKAGDKDKNFNINLEGNYWKCWSGSCNEKAGAKGGDVINFVALMENCSQHEAAKKLAGWFHVGEQTNEKTARHSAGRQEASNEQTPKRTNSKVTSPSGSVKSDTKGYMTQVDAWSDKVSIRAIDEDDAAYRKRLLNAIKEELIRSYRAGQKSKAAA